MSDAERKDSLEGTIADRENNMLCPAHTVHGMSIFRKTVEDVLFSLPPDELELVHEVKKDLDENFGDEMHGSETLYYSIEYIRYLRWLKYAFSQDEGSFRSQHVSYEKTVGKKMFQMFERLDQIRRERAERVRDLVDFEIEVLPEGDAEVKKVTYDYETTAAEKNSQSRDARSDKQLDE